MKKTVAMVLLAPILANAYLDPNLAGRGHQTMKLSRNEICVIPNRLGGLKTDGKPKADYSDKDVKNEAKLCSYDAHINVAACAKTNSTNPGVQFFEIPAGANIAQIEAIECEENTKFPKIKKLAKYKNSTSCSYTPSILSYYHVSRFLGDVNQVPVAVLRTMDVKTHIAIGETVDKSDGTYMTWPSLLKFLSWKKSDVKTPEQSKKAKGLFTEDFSQSYGALQKNPGGEEKYSELFNRESKEEAAAARAGTGPAVQLVRATRFKNENPAYKELANSASLNLKTFNADNAQKVLRMQNVADMILLDTMLSQEDRFGNLHYTIEAFALQKDETGKMNVKKLKELEDGQTYPAGTVQVKKLMMKDNDCGVNRSNHLKKAGLLEGIKHFNPETFKKLLELYKLINSTAGQEFFMKETAMIPADMDAFKANVGHAVKVLVNKCNTKQLTLDLDLDIQFAGESAPDCGAIIQAAQQK